MSRDGKKLVISDKDWQGVTHDVKEEDVEERGTIMKQEMLIFISSISTFTH